jgi:hypothetical protein
MSLIKPEIVILHCSATPDFVETDSGFDKFTILDIEKWHKERGFRKVGYHFVVTRAGLIQSGRDCLKDFVEMGAHCAHENHRSIGVCYVGMKSPSRFQIESLSTLYRQINLMFNFSVKNWYAHNHFNPNKSCPGIDMDLFKKLIKADG